MNDRNILHNDQLDQLITAIAPKAAISITPETSLIGSFSRIDKEARETMQLIKTCGASNAFEPDQTLSDLRDAGLVMAVVVACFLFFCKPDKKLRK